MAPQPPRPTWLMLLGVSALALTASLALVKTLGWGDSGVLNALIVVSTALTLTASLLTRELVGASRAQRIVAFSAVALILGVSLVTAFVFAPIASENALSPPPQRTIGSVRSDCDTPDFPKLLRTSPLRIVSSRAVRAGAGKSDFIAVVSTNPAETRPTDKNATLSILTCQKTNTWVRSISEEINIAGCDASLSTTQLRSANQEEVLFTVACGSGGFLEFSLYGWDADREEVAPLMTRVGLFQGEVAQVADKLVIDAGGVRNEFRWTLDTFAQVTANFAPSAEGVVSAFWWDEDGGHTDLPVVSVQPQERVYFRWDRDRHKDESVRSFRITFSTREEETDPTHSSEDEAEGGVDEYGQWYLILKRQGVNVDVTVHPNGYGDPGIAILVAS